MNQQEFDAKITQANESLTAIGAAIQAESEQIAAFIAAHPELDTSGLDSVVTNLGNVATNIGNIYTPEAPEDPQPEPGE